MMYAPRVQHFFEDLDKQRHAAKLGMWLFLGSEVLFFSGLFAIYAFYRTLYPETFALGVDLNSKLLGSLNTAILIISSAMVATAVNFLRLGRPGIATWLVAGTALAGIVYIAIKLTEYGMHFSHGIYPGGVGSFFVENPDPGFAPFFTSYFALTGLHVIHVAIGVAVLGWSAWWIHRDQVTPPGAYKLGIVALYWHFVDMVWLFVWPLYYLLGAH